MPTVAGYISLDKITIARKGEWEQQIVQYMRTEPRLAGFTHDKIYIDLPNQEKWLTIDRDGAQAMVHERRPTGGGIIITSAVVIPDITQMAWRSSEDMFNFLSILLNREIEIHFIAQKLVLDQSNAPLVSAFSEAFYQVSNKRKHRWKSPLGASATRGKRLSQNTRRVTSYSVYRFLRLYIPMDQEFNTSQLVTAIKSSKSQLAERDRLPRMDFKYAIRDLMEKGLIVRVKDRVLGTSNSKPIPAVYKRCIEMRYTHSSVANNKLPIRKRSVPMSRLYELKSEHRLEIKKRDSAIRRCELAYRKREAGYELCEADLKVRIKELREELNRWRSTRYARRTKASASAALRGPDATASDALSSEVSDECAR